ncbi:MAG: Cell wall surface anchor family protein [Parcubacteria group bacterium LiPW_15]|nr:MAG: Cell wall surface anchor family protein [Parcubacteria group bacterium LiPW_15]
MVNPFKKFFGREVKKRGGFTLIEMVVFTAIFTVTIIAFISVLISITRTQVRQSAVAEVNQQSQFVLQALQYYVERSSLIETASTEATTTITLRMTNTLEDPTLVFASGTQIYSKVGTDPAQALTSGKVTVSNFSMSKRVNAPGKDSLAVTFSISYNTANPQQQFSQALQSAVARVNAATFDSGIFPNADNTLKLGATSQTWQSINDVIYFSGAKVGIGGTPAALFQVHNGDVYIDSSSNGLVLKSSGGTCYRLTVTNGGSATTTAIACP